MPTLMLHHNEADTTENLPKICAVCGAHACVVDWYTEPIYENDPNGPGIRYMLPKCPTHLGHKDRPSKSNSKMVASLVVIGVFGFLILAMFCAAPNAQTMGAIAPLLIAAKALILLIISFMDDGSNKKQGPIFVSQLTRTYLLLENVSFELTREMDSRKHLAGDNAAGPQQPAPIIRDPNANPFE